MVTSSRNEYRHTMDRHKALSRMFFLRAARKLPCARSSALAFFIAVFAALSCFASLGFWFLSGMAEGSGTLLAACGGDSINLLRSESAQEPDACCTLARYVPSPNAQLNCVRWNHTNMVVAAAGEDRRITLWARKLQSVFSFGGDAGDATDETINVINFTNKSSRYICSGGTGKVVRIWDVQKRRCMKWLKGHSDTITDAMYNCRDEQVASVSMRGDLILHNLASGSRVAELPDPHKQVLRVLDFSRLSRHLVVTSGDDGSVHLWDSTGRSPKVSWIKQHLAPTTGVCFAPNSDKVLISVGLDKKLYVFDTCAKRPVHCISCETPYISVAFKDDSISLAAGTSNGRVVLYDVRGKPQVATVLTAFGPTKAVASISWQRSKPVTVNETMLTLELALLGPGGADDAIVMPDPLSYRGRPPAAASLAAGDETRSQMGSNGGLSRMQTLRSVSSSKDDMEVFSPLVDVQPIVTSASRQWDTTAAGKALEMNKVKAASRPDVQDKHLPQVCTPPAVLLNRERSPSVTPPEAWGGEGGTIPAPRVQPSRFSTGISSASASFSACPVGDGFSRPAAIPESPSPSPSTQTEFWRSAPPAAGIFEDSQDEPSGSAPKLATASPSGAEKKAENGNAGLAVYDGQLERSPRKKAQPQQGTFALQLVQRALEESLTGVHKSIHEDVHNLHLELLRQFHIQQSEMEGLMQEVLRKQTELMEQVQSLRRENQQLRQYL